MSTFSRSDQHRRYARGLAGCAALAASLLAMLHFTTAHGRDAVSAARAPAAAAKKAPPEGGAPTRAVGARRFVTAEMKS